MPRSPVPSARMARSQDLFVGEGATWLHLCCCCSEMDALAAIQRPVPSSGLWLALAGGVRLASCMHACMHAVLPCCHDHCHAAAAQTLWDAAHNAITHCTTPLGRSRDQLSAASHSLFRPNKQGAPGALKISPVCNTGKYLTLKCLLTPINFSYRWGGLGGPLHHEEHRSAGGAQPAAVSCLPSDGISPATSGRSTFLIGLLKVALERRGEEMLGDKSRCFSQANGQRPADSRLGKSKDWRSCWMISSVGGSTL